MQPLQISLACEKPSEKLIEWPIITKEGGNIVNAGWEAFDPALAEVGEKKEEGGRELKH